MVRTSSSKATTKPTRAQVASKSKSSGLVRQNQHSAPEGTFSVGDTVKTLSTVRPKQYASKKGRIEAIVTDLDGVVVNECRIGTAWFRFSELSMV